MEDKQANLLAAIQKSQRNATFKQQRLDIFAEFGRKKTFIHNGGIFNAGPELMSAVQLFNLTHDTIIVLDTNNRPIEVAYIEFTDLLKTQYQNAVNWYAKEVKALEKARSLEDMICPKEE